MTCPDEYISLLLFGIKSNGIFEHVCSSGTIGMDSPKQQPESQCLNLHVYIDEDGGEMFAICTTLIWARLTCPYDTVRYVDEFVYNIFIAVLPHSICLKISFYDKAFQNIYLRSLILLIAFESKVWLNTYVYA